MKERTKKRMAKYLVSAQIGIYGFIVLHSILWYVYGVRLISKLCPFVFREQIGNLEFNLTIVFWFLIFSSSLLLGRAFCAWGCMFGAYQDFVARLARKIKIKPMKKSVGKWLVGPIVAFLLATYMLSNTMYWPSPFWFTAVMILAGLGIWLCVERKRRIVAFPKYVFFAWFPGGIVATWVSSSVFQKGISSAFGKYEVFYEMQWGLATIAILVAAGIMIGSRRMFCRYLCPFGLTLKFLSAIPFPVKYKVTAAKGRCVKCGKCDKECLMGIEPMEEIDDHGVVRSPDCINCLSCVSVCPKNVLDFGAALSDAGTDRPTVSTLHDPQPSHHALG